ncbi:hypothetical protein [Sphingopyxis sp. H115]|uniref:hypothetical protein n=1 Tax=Sphingopyxis sp. H115 TaxID=1759073 RepID=UPI00073726A1|nr:hypothetical protein [Sphingopyxis sp. H115]KTE00638.1 hypothetical protein ATE71_21025 [Sphingopyxis sp. H115]
MSLLKKAAISLAATSMILTPLVASAAPVIDASAVSATDRASELEGASWIAIVLGLAIVAGGIWLVVDDNDDEPVSP